MPPTRVPRHSVHDREGVVPLLPPTRAAPSALRAPWWTAAAARGSLRSEAASPFATPDPAATAALGAGRPGTSVPTAPQPRRSPAPPRQTTSSLTRTPPAPVPALPALAEARPRQGPTLPRSRAAPARSIVQ